MRVTWEWLRSSFQSAVKLAIALTSALLRASAISNLEPLWILLITREHRPGAGLRCTTLVELNFRYHPNR